MAGKSIHPNDLRGNHYTLEELTWNFKNKEGDLVREELDKHVVSQVGVWLTVVFLFRTFDAGRQTWSGLKVAYVRYRKVGNGYKKMSSFNYSLEDAWLATVPVDDWRRRAASIEESLRVVDSVDASEATDVAVQPG